MRNADLWTKNDSIRVFCIDKWREDLDRTVTIAHATFTAFGLEKEFEWHGKGVIGTALAGYSDITTYIRELHGPRTMVEEELEAFRKRAKKAGFESKGVFRLD